MPKASAALGWGREAAARPPVLSTTLPPPWSSLLILSFPGGRSAVDLEQGEKEKMYTEFRVCYLFT